MNAVLVFFGSAPCVAAFILGAALGGLFCGAVAGLVFWRWRGRVEDRRRGVLIVPKEWPARFPKARA